MVCRVLIILVIIIVWPTLLRKVREGTADYAGSSFDPETAKRLILEPLIKTLPDNSSSKYVSSLAFDLH